MKKTLSALLASVLLASSLTLTALADVTMYAADGRTISVPESSVEAFETVNWYTAPPVMMYSADGRTIMVSGDKVDAYKAVYWYTSPPVKMFAADGRTILVSEEDVEAYKAVGWFPETTVTMYAQDGRIISVKQSDVEAYKNVGWYTEPQTESQKAQQNAQPPQTQPPAQNYDNMTALNSEQIYAQCSPAVFYLEVYNAAGYILSSGSGFFIDGNGTAITNFHVIDEAATAKIQLPGSTVMYDVTGVYDYDEKDDWAVIKVAYSSSTYLQIGDPSTVVGGAQIYTLGSPEGFQNTISQGIISNPARIEDGVTYIQITAPISHGSSGGALINKYGQVIGITSATYSDGQNLNFAIPMSALAGYSTSSVTPLGRLSITTNAFSSYTYPSYVPPSYRSSYISYYSGFYGIPDFGVVAGATLKKTASTDVAYGYFYYIDFSTDDLDIYVKALENCGFIYDFTYKDSQGNSHLTFTNYRLNYSVSIGLSDPSSSFLVMITRP
ncbi:MAG: trypsin-like serine protease [Ruminococcaceae bacterium]|nr:trypsin-like serine protease [Oscillospiraceae bacterium]